MFVFTNYFVKGDTLIKGMEGLRLKESFLERKRVSKMKRDVLRHTRIAFKIRRARHVTHARITLGNDEIEVDHLSLIISNYG